MKPNKPLVGNLVHKHSKAKAATFIDRKKKMKAGKFKHKRDGYSLIAFIRVIKK